MMTIDDVLQSPCTSEWLRTALNAALKCDPIDAANDADVLRTVLMHQIELAADVAEPPKDLTATMGISFVEHLLTPLGATGAPETTTTVAVASGVPESSAIDDRGSR